MEDKFIPKALANTITEAPIYEMDVVVVEQQRRSLWERIMHPRKEIEKVRHLVFYECYVSTQLKVAGEASLLPTEIFQEQSLNIFLLPEHQPRIVYLVAAALQNNGKEPSKSLMEFIKANMKGSQLRDALVASFQSLNMEAFTDSIILMKGTVKILMPEEMSPTEGSELIASHIATS